MSNDDKVAEKSLWRWLSKHGLTASQAHIQRIESGAGVGVPDVEGCIRGASVWIELKSCKRPARASTPCRPSITREQVLWLKRRWQTAGALSWLLVQVGSGPGARRYLMPGAFAEYVATGLPESTLGLLSRCYPEDSAMDVLLKASQKPSSEFIEGILRIAAEES